MNARPLHLSIALFCLFGVSCLVAALRQLSAGVVIGWFVGGLLVFSLVEYGMHRYFFHLKPSTRLRAGVQFAVHGNHHAHPRQITQIMMKPAIALLVIALTSLVCYGLFGLLMAAFLPGFLLGYSAYLLVHFAVHAYQRPKNFLRHLWTNHHIHHHRSDTTNFGVSSPLWDIVFRTRYRK